MNHTTPRRLHCGAVLAALFACVPIKLDPFDTAGDTDATTSTGGATDDQTSSGAISGDPGGDQTTSTGDPGDETLGGTTSPCEQISDCSQDVDRDGVAFACDNAPEHFNPDQGDLDGDGFPDVIDQCPTLPGDNNNSDADHDGIGNACDLCRLPPHWYLEDVEGVQSYMRVRNIPDFGDADGDGIGDVCDNCVRTPNCQGYGDGAGLTVYVLGLPIDIEAADCQEDADNDGVGDACAGTTLPGAAGPVGLGPDDDFDQDGLTNVWDAAPRQPVAAQGCDGPEDCPEGAACTDGVCGHIDRDNDGVGDVCDTCPFNANPKQNIEGADIEEDPDGDFVGSPCEGAPQCYEYGNPRPLAFYTASSVGLCCVKLYDGGGLLDPDGVPVEPPPKVLATPGLGVLPPGCAAEAEPVTLADVGGDPLALWQFVCRLPQRDQELDGVPDQCDFCPFAFDPGQEHEGTLGTFCTGPYDPSELDPAMMCLPGT
jgi:hypothetical protein